MGINAEVKKAIFLDRDGTINKLVTGNEYGGLRPPHDTNEVSLIKGVTEALLKFMEEEFELFVISNQPDYAKGKTTLKNLSEVHSVVSDLLADSGVRIAEYYYCFHHPEGIIHEFTANCECRKPGTRFIEDAVARFNLDRSSSWIVGDRESDVMCGIRSGIKTAYLTSGQGREDANFGEDLRGEDLAEISVNILKHKTSLKCHQ